MTTRSVGEIERSQYSFAIRGIEARGVDWELPEPMPNFGATVVMQRYDQEVPFVANPDATHCYQAAIKMLVQRFRPPHDQSWAALDRITGKVAGYGTWPFAGLTWLRELGLDVTNLELMDNRRFAAEGRAYIAEVTGQEFAESLDRGLDLSRVQAEAAIFVEKIRCEVRIPTIDDIRSAVTTGGLVVCNVNSRALNDRDGYLGHFVVVKGFDEHGLIVHDPGPPGQENRRVSFDAFERAWAYPKESVKWLAVVRDAGQPPVEVRD